MTFNIKVEYFTSATDLYIVLMINPYSAKGLGDRLYENLHKMPGEDAYSFCSFLKLKNSPLYTFGSHFIQSTARAKPSLLNHFSIYYRLL